MKVILREVAYDDLDRLYAWIAKNEPRTADVVIRRILESADLLGRFPHVGHLGSVRGTREWIVPQLPYILVYRIHDNDELVSIDTIFLAAQDRRRK